MKTKIPCPAPACGWYRVIDHFAKSTQDVETQLRNHIDNLHPWYRVWLKYGYWNKRRKARKAGK